ncbi:MAG: PilZ domain-containing protein [bacterium]|nr:PilZ domain-containing protein [bacterium]
MIKQPKLVVKGRRRVSRLKVRGKIKILEKALFAKTEPFEVKMYDISEGGAKIVSEKQLKPKQEVVLSFQTKEMIKPIEMKGAVLWTRILKSGDKEYTLAGLKFVSQNEKLFERVATMLYARML